MPPVALVDPATIDCSRILYSLEEIRRSNQQRFEMEQLSAIVHMDVEAGLIIGYKDVTDEEFWIRGHMPGYPLMPGVVMCEAAAQLCSFFCVRIDLTGENGFLGFAGMEDVKFRGQVKPGQRLLIVGKAVRLHKRQTVFDTQGFVDGNMVFQARVMGVTIFGSEE
jgi:3-hydroxyacyl-[acyl-carrier-protein] dehydratase